MTMSYCQWENAASDLRQCLDTFEEEGQAMIDELRRDHANGYPHEWLAFRSIIEMVDEFKALVESHELDGDIPEEDEEDEEE